METLNEKYYKEALKQDPQGCICYCCGDENKFCDDCGFFYAYYEREEGERSYRAICESCHDFLGLSTAER